MKLEKNILDLIMLAVDTSKLLNIEEIIIDKSGIRAIHPERIALILFKADLSNDLPFDSIGINRLPTFIQRLSIIKDIKDISAEFESDNNNNVKSIKFHNKKLSISYRCANPMTIKAPKNIKDVFTKEVNFTEEAFNMLSKGFSAMKSEVFTLISDNSGVRFELMDSNNDVFTYQFSEEIENKNDDVKFVHKYPIKIFLPILKQNTNSTLYIGEQGVLKIIINGLDLIILPKK